MDNVAAGECEPLLDDMEAHVTASRCALKKSSQVYSGRTAWQQRMATLLLHSPWLSCTMQVSVARRSTSASADGSGRPHATWAIWGQVEYQAQCVQKTAKATTVSAARPELRPYQDIL